MTVLVTGANGFIGAALVQQLLARGQDVRALVRPQSRRHRLEALAEPGPGKLKLVLGSLATVAAADEAIGPASTIYHLAASMRGAPSDMFCQTLLPSRNLLEAATARPEPPKIVLTSSFSVYGVASLPTHTVVDERTPLESQPRRRDPYSQVKLRQEQLFWEHRLQHPYALVVVRPGVVYGPGGGRMSARVGVQLPGLFLFLGGDNLLPLSYVENCANAIACCGECDEAVGEVFNIHDDELITARDYLTRYQRRVGRLRHLLVPYPLTQLGSRFVAWYHEHSKGQLPAIFTPYKTASMWQSFRYDNSRLRGIGWRPRVSTDLGLERTFAALAAG